MKPTSIVCPKCQTLISIDEALSHKLEEELKNKLAGEYSTKLEEEKKKLWMVAQEKAAEKINAQKEAEVKLLKEEAEVREKELAKAREQELTLRKEKNQLDDERKAFELEKQRQLDSEREKIRKSAEETEAEKHRLLESEKNKQIEGMKKTIEELQQKANQGSQQLQGEVLELEIEALLKSNFTTDEVAPVPKGVYGADVLQKVRDQSGTVCGIIVWESKRTKSWDKTWSAKLKEDLMRVKGDVAVLVSVALPDEIKNFGLRDGIFVTSFEHFLNVAQILRKNLLDSQRVKMSVVGKNTKMEMLYNYISSNEFVQKVELMLEACTSMRATLQKERMTMEKLWSQREKEIEKVVGNTAAIHGSLTGIIGASMPEIESLEPEALIKEPSVEISQSVLFEDPKVAES